MTFVFIAIKVVLSIIGLLCFVKGVVAVRNPLWVIHIQQTWARRINWKMEPVDMELELRSTRRMGWMLIIGSIALWFVLVFVLLVPGTF